MTEMRVSDAMTASPSTIEPADSVTEAARRMQAEDVGALPVVQSGELVGMVTDRDLVIHVLAKDLDPNKTQVAEVCSQDPIVAQPDEPLDEALSLMAAEKVRRLPVVSEGRLVGILAQADVARLAEPTSTGQLVEEISRD
jgi:CBS domain-containing protein